MRIRFPDFICVGAQKCGTTWLYENLISHPGIGMPPVKELQYFNEIWLPYQRDWAQGHRRKQVLDHLEWYLKNVPRSDWNAGHINNVMQISEAPICDDWYGRIFGEFPDDIVLGEMTPEYALLPLMGYQHILRLNKNAKFIFLVRDPIERAWSQIKMIVRNEGREPSIDTYLDILKYDDIRMRSDYYETINTIRQAGVETNLYVNTIDAIIAEPQRTLQEICQFIGVPFEKIDLSRAKDIVHAGIPGPIPPELIQPMWEQLAVCYNRFENFAPEQAQQWRERPRS